LIVSKLKQVMQAKKVSIRRLVRDSGLSEETILRARRGGGPGQLGSCTLLTLETIARALHVEIKDLFEEIN
jgi:DNA-binding Xre family transcriptional regulator